MRPEERSQQRRVAVVGGGLAGLAAAIRLSRCRRLVIAAGWFLPPPRRLVMP